MGIRQSTLLLADDQGLGKTKEALDITAYRHSVGMVQKCLVVCGVNSTKYNWEREIAMHTDLSSQLIDGSNPARKIKQIDEWLSGDAVFGIINIEALRKKEITDALNDDRIQTIIVDEIHKAKNGNCQQGKALRGLNAKYKIGLTGTPITNKAEDLWNILAWLEIESRSYWKFRREFCIEDRWGNVIRYRNLASLNLELNTVMLRRKKEDVIDLPEKIYLPEYVELSKAEQKLYRDTEAGILKIADELVDTSNILAEITRLRQITAGLYTPASDNAKLKRLREMLEDEILPAGGKVLVFSFWEEVAKLYREAFSDYNPAFISGSVSVADRQREVDRFQNEASCQIIIGTIGAMGTGLTLNKATHVIFLDKAWTAANNLQAEDRAHRIGTEHSVNIISMIAKNTIDERVEKRLEENADLFERVVEGTAVRTDTRKMLLEILGASENVKSKKSSGVGSRNKP